MVDAVTRKTSLQIAPLVGRFDDIPAGALIAKYLARRTAVCPIVAWMSRPEERGEVNVDRRGED
jgi:hypothetical protein